jgi:exosortase E/protease (VPEID-CTERM system)
MAAFAVLSSLLYSNVLSGPQANALALGWIATGIAAAVLAALAFLPSAAWVGILRATGSLWIYASLAAVAIALSADSARALWLPLTSLTIRIVAAMLRVFITGVITDPSQQLIRVPHFEAQIAPECSGFEGMGLILGFGIVWLLLFRKECRFPQALLLLPAGVVLIYMLNAVRLAALILIGNAGAPQIAMGGFHSQAGWIAFAAASLGFSFAARRVPWITLQREPVAYAPNPTEAYLVPFLAILAAGMLSTAFSAHFEWPYALRFAAAAAALFYYRESYRKLDWRFGWQGPAAGALIFLLWIALDRWSGVTVLGAMPPALAEASAAPRIAWIVFRAVAATVTVPIAEELAFRGYLLRRFVSADFEAVAWRAVPLSAIVMSSVLFGAMHGSRWIGGSLAGLAYAWVAVRRQRIGEAVAAHAVSNALIAAYVLAFGHWELW